MTDHRTYWKKLVSRACPHAILQRRRQQDVCDLHQRISESIFQHVHIAVDPRLHDPPADEHKYDQKFGCMTCRLQCLSQAGGGAHMFKVHKIRAWNR